ncbi:restriction endonuclease subunit S [Succinatimonas hippei]|uniref:restriction endonuclease subunit S n=1 Tax=Succinatimonas hippei TaxID=626938 RepID=UPI00201362E9|nr:restriction endonuclease subunit S [Succinatimonas hippei]MCL1602518.1 restriction endonuclease subunit S [Succinatimonas hippei]
MTPEIKQRIEQICRGEVPDGYKKGKLGVVPEEWEETSFSTLFTSTSDYTDDLEKYPLYSLTIEDGITPKTERYERSHLVKKEDSYKIVRPNDYAYNPMNLRFGAVARHKGDMPVAVSGYYDIFTTVFESDLPFMDSFLTCGPMITYYNRVSTGSLVEKQRVHFSQFLEFMLPLPSINERTKIAAILTTQDKVIELKEKRLAEKQRQKKYLMQQLLTGKKRLPGFSGQWEIKGFNQVFTFGATNTFSRECMCEDSTGVKNIHYGDILVRYGEVLKLSEQEIPSLLSDIGAKITTFVDDGDVVIADTAEDLTAGKVVEVQETHGKKVAAGLHTMLCKPIKGCFAPGWLGYYMNSETYHKQLVPYIAGVKVMSISKGNIVKTHILVPPIEEQTAIVKVFSTTDHEIDLLQRDIEQEKQKKKALMQLLLTGIVRVKT